MNGLVTHKAAGHFDIGERRRLEVAGHHVHHLHRANVTAKDTLANGLELGQETTAKSHEYRRHSVARLRRERPDLGQIDVDGLFAIDGLARAHRPAQQVNMGVGRRGDENSVDGVGGPDFLRGSATLPPTAATIRRDAETSTS